MAVTNLVVTVEIPEQLAGRDRRGPGKTVQEARLVQQVRPCADSKDAPLAVCARFALAARKRGDSRVRVSIQADQIDKPLAREESILILSESPEPTAARSTR